MAGRRDEEEMGISGGRFANPGILPPPQGYRVATYPVMMEPGEDMPFHIGAAMTGCGLTLVTVLVGKIYQTLWQNGSLVSPAPAIPAGVQEWEIHTTYNIISDSDCSWGVTCMVNNAPASPQGGHFERTSSPISRMGQTGWDFNCGAMPASAVSVRIKFWYIADHLSDYPTQDMF